MGLGSEDPKVADQKVDLKVVDLELDRKVVDQMETDLIKLDHQLKFFYDYFDFKITYVS